MSTSGGILSLVDHASLRVDVDRVAAAAGMRVVHAAEPSSPKVWTGASAVVVDVESARRCLDFALPRRPRVYLVGHDAPTLDEWQTAMAVGVQAVLTLPAEEAQLVKELSDAAEVVRAERRGPVVAVVGGRGGAGASVLATALALTAREPLLVDVDPWGGGIDLLLGSESEPGLRWPDVALHGGRVSYSALRDALPSRRGVTVLSAGRNPSGIDATALTAVIDAGCRSGTTVVCDVPRRESAAAEAALEVADLVVLVTTADVRGCAATGAVGVWLRALNPNVGVVVRGPAPGGLRPSEVAAVAGLVLLAAMRPQHQLAAALEHGGLILRPRSPLARASRRVHAVLSGQPRDLSAEPAA